VATVDAELEPAPRATSLALVATELVPMAMPLVLMDLAV